MQTLSNVRPLLRLRSRETVSSFEDEAVGADDEVLTEDLASSPSIDSGSLLRGGKRVQISHNGSLYLLQTTKQGKLILTK